MGTETKAKPTEAAERAFLALMREAYRRDGTPFPKEPTPEQISECMAGADIIDRETGLPELLSVCKQFMAWHDKQFDERITASTIATVQFQIADAARAAIAKAEARHP